MQEADIGWVNQWGSEHPTPLGRSAYSFGQVSRWAATDRVIVKPIILYTPVNRQLADPNIEVIMILK